MVWIHWASLNFKLGISYQINWLKTVLDWPGYETFPSPNLKLPKSIYFGPNTTIWPFNHCLSTINSGSITGSLAGTKSFSLKLPLIVFWMNFLPSWAQKGYLPWWFGVESHIVWWKFGTPSSRIWTSNFLQNWTKFHFHHQFLGQKQKGSNTATRNSVETCPSSTQRCLSYWNFSSISQDVVKLEHGVRALPCDPIMYSACFCEYILAAVQMFSQMRFILACWKIMWILMMRIIWFIMPMSQVPWFLLK